jgi:osmotically-inducible protein OsmY
MSEPSTTLPVPDAEPRESILAELRPTASAGPAAGEVFFNGKPFRPELLIADDEPVVSDPTIGQSSSESFREEIVRKKTLAGHLSVDDDPFAAVVDDSVPPELSDGSSSPTAGAATLSSSTLGASSLSSSKLTFLAGRSERERKAGTLMAVGVLVLLVVQLFVVRPAIERKLVKRAQAVLLLDGSKAVKVTASGRDLSLAGYVASEDARKRAISVVQARRGVRVVDGAKLAVDAGLAAAGGSLSLGDTPPLDSTVPVRTGDGAGDQGAVDSVAVSDPAQAATAAALEAERAKPMRRAKVSARITGGKVTVEGNVPSDEGRDQLLGRTRQNLGEENVIDLLALPAVSEERADLNDYRRVGQLLSIVSSFPGAEMVISYDRGSLQISGTVTSNNDLALAQGEVRKLVPDESLRTARLSVGPATTGTTATTAVIAGAETTSTTIFA